MKIGLAQLNPTVADIRGNTQKILDVLDRLNDNGADLIVLSELVVTGYPPKDLLENSKFIGDAQKADEELKKWSAENNEVGVVYGNVSTSGGRLYNSCHFILDGRTVGTYNKRLLPSYDVFDEARYFTPGSESKVFEFMGVDVGLTVCEDSWYNDMLLEKRYDVDPVRESVYDGADMVINVSASPYSLGKDMHRYRLFRDHCSRFKIPMVFVNQVGANDELVFDGTSMAIGIDGEVVKKLKSFEEDYAVVDFEGEKHSGDGVFLDDIEGVRKCLVLGVRDYFRKCNFKKAVLGLSGGVDSSLVCAIACEALGAENVLGLIMPGPYSSPESIEDARKLAANLGVKTDEVPITGLYDAYNDTLDVPFEGLKQDITEENIQARIRGNILMAYSNKLGYLVLSTGNKSELAVGYCTLYGDMSGGLSVISDVPKTMVYELSRDYNKDAETIPERVIHKEPSAELKADQKDSDTLPDYAVLDKILFYFIDKRLSSEKVIDKGFDEDTVRWVADALKRNEYKRRQAALGIKVTSKSFGFGRRMPIAADYDL